MPRINWKNVNIGDKAIVAQCFTATYPSGTVTDYTAPIRFPQQATADGQWLQDKSGLLSPAAQWASMRHCGLHLGNDMKSLRNDTGHYATKSQVAAFAATNGLDLVTVG